MNRKFYQWAVVSVCTLMSACSWNKEAAQPVVYIEAKPAITAWVADTEALLRESIKDSPFTLHQQDNTWVVSAPAQQLFNPDRPDLLLPVVLRPITRLAKVLEGRPDSAVLILGHTDVNKDDKINYKLSTGRARAVASIFRLSGLKGTRLTHLGMGSSFTLSTTTNSSTNHRVEIIITPDTHMQDVMALYGPTYNRQLALSQPQ